MNHHEHRVIAHSGTNGVDLFFFGDLQEGVEGFRDDAWGAFRDDWKRSLNPYAVGMGDYRDWLRPSIRGKISPALHKDPSAHKQLDDMVHAGIEASAERFEFMKGRILGLHEGHHEWDFKSGANTTMLLAERLKTLNLGWISSNRLIIVHPGRARAGRDMGHAFTFVSSHGNPSGRYTPSVARSMEMKMESFVCDLKVMGHACRSASWSPQEYHLIRRSGPPGIVRVQPRMVLVGGFVDAYTDGWTSKPKVDNNKKIGGRPKEEYAALAGLQPQPLMWAVVRIRLARKAAEAKERNISHKAILLDVEAVNRGPAITGEGLYQ